MSIPGMPAPDIVLCFRGLLVLHLDEGDEECKVGILRSATSHNFLLEIRKFTLDGGETVIKQYTKKGQLDRDLSLKVTKTTEEHIKFYKPTKEWKRTDIENNDPHDFRWALDFEGDEVYDERVKLDQLGFSSIFNIKSHGLFFTAKLSDDELIVIRGVGDETTIGHVAIKVAALIYLDKPESKAVFTNPLDPRPVTITRQEGVIHRILVSESRPSTSTGSPNDSVLYSQAIVEGLNSRKRIHFDSTMLRRLPPTAEKLNQGQGPLGGQQDKQEGQGRPIITGKESIDLILDRMQRSDPMATCLTAQLTKS